ncbi:AraC family transcriptional regulator [Acinetobacter baumannii]|uniref:AraC family transcriptional regulator n=1 Tax=Acinetobacter baumannii TaxID=470 RepID=UPI0020C68964|nr:helix-turn-helix transcriptional regulator [Acinetobacter baumannii]
MGFVRYNFHLIPFFRHFMNFRLASIEQVSLDKPLLFAVENTANEIRITPRHHHERGQLIGAKKGLLSIYTDQERWLVPATHVVWIPPNVEHGLYSHGPFSGWSVYIAKSACVTLPDQPCVFSISGLLREAVLRLIAWENNTIDIRKERLSEVIIDEIALLPKVELSVSMPKDIRLLKIAKALIAQPSDTKKIEEWASWGGISPRTLTRKFTLETGFSFNEWKKRMRLLKAIEMLAVGNTVKSTALDLGYNNVSAFISTFKKVFGMTPKEYANQKF